jgi:NAD(P)-dependent dehydrogenase (short-subunit alcohol dehydrogenase family)
MTGGRLAGRTAVIVGAGQTPGSTIGNGRATSLRFAQEGADLLLVDRDGRSAEETADAARRAGGHVEVLELDIAAAGAPEELVNVAGARLGRIDVLHHNVGIATRDSSPTRLEEEAWDLILDVNLKAMWLTAKHVIPVMRSQGAGAVVCVSSIAAIASAGNLTAYKVSKAGVNALVQTLAITNARFGIRVNGIMPGFIDTPMAVDAAAQLRGIDREEVAAERARAVPLGGRQGTAWDVANAALFLASDEAAFITGVVLAVDGGQSCRIG